MAAEVAIAYNLPMSYARAATSVVAVCVEETRNDACARHWIDRLRPVSTTEARIWIDYIDGVVQLTKGRWHDALSAASRAETWSRRLGMTAEQTQAIELSVNALAEAGRGAEAELGATRLFDAAKGIEVPCLRAAVVNNAAWARQILVRSGYDVEPPIAWMVESLEIYESGECYDELGAIGARIGLAHVLLSAGEVDAAEQQFETLDMHRYDPAGVSFFHEIEMLELALALETNRWDRYAADVLAPTKKSELSQHAWQRSMLTGEALERFGLDAAALDEWISAEAALDAENEALPVSGGREYLTTSKFASTVGLVEARLRLGELDEALCAARLARARSYSRIAGRDPARSPRKIRDFQAWLRTRNAADADAREDWRYSAAEGARRRDARRAQISSALEQLIGEEGRDGEAVCAGLASPAAGEAILLLLPTNDDTIVVSQSRGVVRIYRTSEVPYATGEIAAWASGVVALVDGDIRDAESIRVLPVGRAWAARLHAVRYRSGYLGWEKAVSYGLDLPPLREQHAARSAVIVTDPSGDLPEARKEGMEVSESLERSGWDVVRMDRDDMTRQSVLTAMAETQLLYYAGHGARRGDDGWDSELLLSDSESLSVHDVLSALSVPRFAVLAGCETGALSSLLADGGMSIGRAMLVAGSEAVIVGDREVPDVATRMVMHAAFEDLSELEGRGLPAFLHRALRHPGVRSLDPDAWSAFRVLVR